MFPEFWYEIYCENFLSDLTINLISIYRLGVQRKHRFSEQFHEDTTNLVSAITSDIISKWIHLTIDSFGFKRHTI